MYYALNSAMSKVHTAPKLSDTTNISQAGYFTWYRAPNSFVEQNGLLSNLLSLVE